MGRRRSSAPRPTLELQQPSDLQPVQPFKNAANVSAGVLNPRHFRGVAFIRAERACTSALVCSVTSVSIGRKHRRRPCVTWNSHKVYYGIYWAKSAGRVPGNEINTLGYGIAVSSNRNRGSGESSDASRQSPVCSGVRSLRSIVDVMAGRLVTAPLRCRICLSSHRLRRGAR